MTRLMILPAIFVAATCSLWLMIRSAPGWDTPTNYSTVNGSSSADPGGGENGGGGSNDNQRTGISIPTQFDNFTVVAQQFRTYKEEHYIYITTLFVSAYLYKQTFAIPGSFLLNIIAGTVFGMWTGFILVCCLTTLGSSLCYLFSELFSREYVLYYFGEKLTYLQQKVDDNSHRLLPFLLFARMFPISPSWLLNIVAPFLNIPLGIFAISALIGLAPYNFICVQAGYILSDLRSWDDIFSTSTMFKLCSFALLPLAYAMFLRQKASTTDDVSDGSNSTKSGGRPSYSFRFKCLRRCCCRRTPRRRSIDKEAILRDDECRLRHEHDVLRRDESVEGTTKASYEDAIVIV